MQEDDQSYQFNVWCIRQILIETQSRSSLMSQAFLRLYDNISLDS